MSFGPHTVTVINRGWDGATRDRHNNKVIANLDAYELSGCFLQQRNTDETLDARDSVETTWVLIAPPLPAGRSVGPLDRIIVDTSDALVPPDDPTGYYGAVAFEIIGNPDQLPHITGDIHHLELILGHVKL